MNTTTHVHYTIHISKLDSSIKQEFKLSSSTISVYQGVRVYKSLSFHVCLKLFVVRWFLKVLHFANKLKYSISQIIFKLANLRL